MFHTLLGNGVMREDIEEETRDKNYERLAVTINYG